VVDFQERNFTVFANRQPTETDKYTINDRAWLWLLGEYAFQEEYDRLGIEISADEKWEMMQGSHIDPTIQAIFTNQETGQFDRAQFMEFYRNRAQAHPQLQYIWSVVQPNIEPSRERLKYENLLIKSTFVTESEGMKAYHDETDVAEVNYLYVPFYSLSDTAIDITDQELRAYFNEKKERYRTEHQKSLKYITFPIVSSPEDTLAIIAEMNELKTELGTVSDDSLYASSNSDGTEVFGRYHRGTLPYTLSMDMDSLQKGDLYGPILMNDNYTLYKVTSVYDDSVYNARASHILFRWDDESDEAKAKARIEAAEVLMLLKNGGDFKLLAREHSDDGSAQRGGDLGWFSTGRMVEEFEEAVFATDAPGLIPRLIETQYGYHIIEVTEVKTNRMYAVATIERKITPSNTTINEAYRKADYFKSETTSLKEFEANASRDSLQVRDAENLKAMDRFVGDLGNARAVVQWLFRDAKVGSVSSVFEVNDNYVVAVMTTETEEGYPSLDQVKAQIEPEVAKKLKAVKIKAKLASLSGSLQEMATAYGEDANVYSTSDLKLSSNSLPNVGFDPLAVGAAFSLENGAKTAPFSSENGVLIIEMVNKTVAPEIADYTSYKSSLATTAQNNASQKISNTIEDAADIKDKRYKVY
ncbi:MAG: peptidylprolyl isomerase, partial [Cyclobacteriaceae bacterium]|nr:peptidylprolyl isomerase [Cyclobacteriaceae bacterium]